MTMRGIPPAEVTLTRATWTVELELSALAGVHPQWRIVLDHVAYEASKQTGHRISPDNLPQPEQIGRKVQGRVTISRFYRWTAPYFIVTESE